jgi:hypothetical protein
MNMKKQLLLLGIVFSVFLIIPSANAQIFEKATFQETATIIYDQKFSGSIITSIGFETTDNKEIRFTDKIIEGIKDNDKIRAIVFTNTGQCVIGITSEEQCIMINFDYQMLKGDGGIRMVQDSARDMGDRLIDELNDILGMKAKFHSTFIHTVDDTNILLETSGAISGRGAVSATYTMPKQSTDYLFVDLSGKLIPKEIREGGGFYDIMKELANDKESVISTSIIKTGDSNLFMFKVANENENAISDISEINILDELEVNTISRSDVFDGRNVPLNSVIQLLLFPNEQVKINAIATHAITDVTTMENISKKGWFFSSPAGNKIDAKFLFGQDKIVTADELRIEIGPWDGQTEMSFYSVEDIQYASDAAVNFNEENTTEEDQSQYLVLGIIIVAGIGAIIFYLKGYKPKH